MADKDINLVCSLISSSSPCPPFAALGGAQDYRSTVLEPGSITTPKGNTMPHTDAWSESASQRIAGPYIVTPNPPGRVQPDMPRMSQWQSSEPGAATRRASGLWCGPAAQGIGERIAKHSAARHSGTTLRRMAWRRTCSMGNMTGKTRLGDSILRTWGLLFDLPSRPSMLVPKSTQS